MIDRKYNRTADTGRFELIHKGTPVPVPIYVGIDLRVEGKNRKTIKVFFFVDFIQQIINLGKTCRTGRPTNNNSMMPTDLSTNNISHNNTNNFHGSAPPHMTHMSSTSVLASISTTPAENRPNMVHSASPLASHAQSSNPKNSSSPVSLKLRREMTQPTLTRVEVVPLADSPLERLAANDMYSFNLRSVPNNNNNPFTVNNNNNNSFKLNPSQPTDTRQRQSRMPSTRLTVDYLPIRQISRTKATNALPSPKGKKRKCIFSIPSAKQKSIAFPFNIIFTYKKEINSCFLKIY